MKSVKVWWGLAGAAALASVAAKIAYHDAAHARFWWHEVPAFDLVYGFAGCLAIIVLSKALGKLWLQRPEGYYDEEGR